MSEQEAQERIAAQMPLSEKARLADYVIDNNETLEATQQQVTILCKGCARGRRPWECNQSLHVLTKGAYHRKVGKLIDGGRPDGVVADV